MGTYMVLSGEQTNICDISEIIIGLKQRLHQLKALSVIYAENNSTVS